MVTIGRGLLRIAAARELLQMEATALPEIYEWPSRVEVVFVIANGKADGMQQHQ